MAVINNPTQVNVAYMWDLTIYGILGYVVQMCDVYLTYSRYIMMAPPSRWFAAFVHCYIFFVLVCTYLPFQTIVPIFTDTNAPYSVTVQFALLDWVYLPGYIAYDLFFMHQFVYQLYQFYFAVKKVEVHPRLLILAVKSSLHLALR